MNSGGALRGLQQQLRSLLLQHQHQQQHQRRGISTSAATALAYKFQFNVSPSARGGAGGRGSRVATRDNYQRWRESGGDVRVAQDILREAEEDVGAGGSRRSRSRRGARAGGRGGGGGGGDVHEELKRMVLGCRDLAELQVVIRECGGDMNAFLVCAAAARLHKLKQATPPGASPAVLARRLGETLMVLMQDRLHEPALSHLGAALHGLAEADGGLVPGAALLEAVADRCEAPSPRGGTALQESDGRTVSVMMLSAAKFLSRQQQAAAAAGRASSSSSSSSSSSGSSTSGSDGASGSAVDAAVERLWAVVRAAAEVKLLRALGEEPEGSAAAPVGGGEGGPEVDDSLPQSSLRAIAKALVLSRDTSPPAVATWAAAARLAARHAAELQPGVAAAVLRSYCQAGGPAALDGGREGLAAAVWAALGPQAAELDVGTLLDLTYAAAKLAAAPPGSAAGGAHLGADMLRPLCDALTPRVPALSCADVASLATGLAAALGAAAGSAPAVAAAAAPPLLSPSHFGSLPRLLSDLLLLRGPATFGGRNFASVALAMALISGGPASASGAASAAAPGGLSPAFWPKLAAAALPEVPRMDAGSLSRLAGAFCARPAAPAASVAAAAAEPAAAAPSPEFVAAVYGRAAELLDGAAGGVGVREAVHLLRCLAEWPAPAAAADGAAAAAPATTLTRLADLLAAADSGAVAVAAPAAVRQALAVKLGAVGLGSHAAVAKLG
ncbi:hypothetical protein HYH02_007534 [Chlamydomonas schloesseri]|uniref:Uncharacterized protein n=1 Tax=Chlamydomonas schloesseri TaxID=2026947 RepID=A0A835WIK1_9CHLO|nr:hypothetical protein HYH02_007534 [Chlamydomonas schloesseri]|eukprot:KAG2447615.1 hypothetical protein HYH02_007534 [Chlamydomonas schloesseri]